MVAKMNKIDISSWKEFEIGKLFPNIITPNVYHSREVKESESDVGIPYVVRTKFNNGIKCLVNEDDKFVLNPSGVISFGAENSSFFYRDDPYISGRDMYYIDTRGISKNACLFLIACFETVTERYPYNYGLFPKFLKKEKIFLPVDNNGNPNWDYMDSFIENRKELLKNKLKDTYGIKPNKHAIDFSNWKLFKLTDLFEITGTSTTKKTDIPFKDDGKYPYITTAATNNGVAGYSDIYTEEGNVLTVDSAVVGTCLYQEKNFTASDHVEKLIPKFHLNKDIGLFLACIINAAGKPLNYAYNEKRSQTALKKEKIFLPADSNGKPDWDYMEKYMKEFANQKKDKFELLISCFD